MHVFLFIIVVGDPGLYSPSNRGVLGPVMPKSEGGPDPARSNWLPHMHMPRKNFYLDCFQLFACGKSLFSQLSYIFFCVGLPNQSQVPGAILNNQPPSGSTAVMHNTPTHNSPGQFYNNSQTPVNADRAQEAIPPSIGI